MKDADQQALGVIWKVRLENARNRYQAAKATVQGVRDFQGFGRRDCEWLGGGAIAPEP